MKKITAVVFLGIFIFSTILPLSRADADEAAGAGMSGSPQEAADLQKTLRSGRIDNLEQRVSELEQANATLSERVDDLERTVDDFNSRT